MRDSRPALPQQLFADDTVVIPMPDADVRLWPGFLAPGDADRLLASLEGELPWRRDRITVFGRAHLIPRMHSWHGDSCARYRWSGLTQEPCFWTPALAELRDRIQALLHCRFNSVLANLYRDGRDHMGWHADDEPELGKDPVIASVSLGAGRDFIMRYRGSAEAIGKQRMLLTHGSLLVMSGATQRHWQHSLPRRLGVHDARINLTFRYVVHGR